MSAWTRYRLVTRWRTPAPLERVWDVILHADDWPTWWKGLERVDAIAPGRADGIGAVRRYVWRSAMAYRVIFDIESTRIEPLRLLEGKASGQVAGWGRWHF